MYYNKMKSMSYICGEISLTVKYPVNKPVNCCSKLFEKNQQNNLANSN